MEGLPVKPWKRGPMPVGLPLKPERDPRSNFPFTELAMPKDAHLLCPMSQALLQAARAGRINTPQADEEVKNKSEEAKAGPKHSDQGAFVATKWQPVPSHLEEPEVEYLAKRRKGLPPLGPNGLPPSYPAGGVMVRTKVRRIDAEGNGYVENVVVPEGHTVDGQVIADAGQNNGGGPEGGAVDADGLVVGGAVQPTPPRRRPPPPRRKAKGSKGRKRKIVQNVASIEGGPDADGSGSLAANGMDMSGAADSSTMLTEDGQTLIGEGDTEMDESNLPDGEEGDDDEEGEEGEEEEEGEEGEDDDREVGELSDHDVSTSPLKPAPTEQLASPSKPAIAVSSVMEFPTAPTSLEPPSEPRVGLPGLTHPLPMKPEALPLPPKPEVAAPDPESHLSSADATLADAQSMSLPIPAPGPEPTIETMQEIGNPVNNPATDVPPPLPEDELPPAPQPPHAELPVSPPGPAKAPALPLFDPTGAVNQPDSSTSINHPTSGGIDAPEVKHSPEGEQDVLGSLDKYLEARISDAQETKAEREEPAVEDGGALPVDAEAGA